jgi:WXXGXW repeat (2 copies)
MQQMKKLLLLFVLFVSTFMSDLSAQISVQIGYPPPPPPRRIESPLCPGPDYAWVDGRWVWDDYVRDYVWQRGYWAYIEPRQHCDDAPRYYKKGRGHYKEKRHHKYRRNDDRYDD